MVMCNLLVLLGFIFAAALRCVCVWGAGSLFCVGLWVIPRILRSLSNRLLERGNTCRMDEQTGLSDERW